VQRALLKRIAAAALARANGTRAVHFPVRVSRDISLTATDLTSTGERDDLRRRYSCEPIRGACFD